MSSAAVKPFPLSSKEGLLSFREWALVDADVGISHGKITAIGDGLAGQGRMSITRPERKFFPVFSIGKRISE